jgi:type I restriction enzyme S subunit
VTIGIPILQIVQENENGLLSADPSWSRVLLGEVAQVLNGFAFPSKNFSGVEGKPLLRIRDILQDQTAVLYDGQYDTAYLVHPNDLVIGMDGDFNCALWKGPEALLNQRACKVTSNELFYSSKFLKYVLPGYLQAVNARTSSQTVKHLSSKTVADIPLPLPPLPEQHRIVAKIEELFTRLDAGVEALKKIKSELRRYRQAVLKHAFEGKLTEEWRQAHKEELEPTSVLLERIKQERQKTAKSKCKKLPPLDTSDLPGLPDGWVWTRIGEVESFIGSGITPRGGRNVYVSSGIPFIRSQNVYPNGLHLNDIVYITPEMDVKMQRTAVHSGDVLLNITGASIGRSTFVPNHIDTANVNQHVCIIRIEYDVLPTYLSSYLNSTLGQSQIWGTQGGVTRQGLNYQQVRLLRFPICSLPEQQQIVTEIERRFSIADQIEKTVDHSLKQAEREPPKSSRSKANTKRMRLV